MMRNMCWVVICSTALLLHGTSKASAQVVYGNTTVYPQTTYSYIYPYGTTVYPGVTGYYGGRFGYRRASFANGAYFGYSRTGYGGIRRTGYGYRDYRR